MMNQTENNVKIQFTRCYNKLINQTANFLPDDDKQIYASKCNKTSLQYKNEGNAAYAKEDMETAQSCYSQALVFAEYNSEVYGMAFGNRSAAFFESGKYKECLLDITDCLTSSYPEEHRAKLLERIKKCEEQINDGQQFELPPQDPLPVLNNKNVDLFGASSAVELSYSILEGRHIVAADDINAGELLFVEPAFAFGQIFESKNKFKDDSKCSNCLRCIYRSIPCKTCSICRYCCSTCRDDSWNDGHRWECPGMKYGFWYDIGLGFTAFRALVKGIPSKFQALSDPVTQRHKVLGNGYEYFNNLESHLNDMSDETLKNICSISAHIVRYLELKTDFFAHLEENGFGSDLAISADCIGVLLVKHLAQLSCNASILEHSNPKISRFDEFTPIALPVASGIYTTGSLMNHSCKSNIALYFMDKYLIVKALENISKGQQISNSYGIDYRFSEKQERQEHLKELYYFDCNCTICSDESKEFRNLDSIYCPDCKKCVYLPIRNFDSVTICRNCNATIRNFVSFKNGCFVVKKTESVAQTHELNLKNFKQLFRMELEKGNFLEALDYLAAYSECLKARIGCYHIDYGIALFKKIESVVHKMDEVEQEDIIDIYKQIKSLIGQYFEDLSFIFAINYPYYDVGPLQSLTSRFEL